MEDAAGVAHGASLSPPSSRIDEFSVPYAAIEPIFSLISSTVGCNSISLVCKHWHSVERHNRRRVFIQNYDTLTPLIIRRRYPNVRSLVINGDPTETNKSVEHRWVTMIVSSYPQMEEITLTDMQVYDFDLELLGKSLPNLAILVLSPYFMPFVLGLRSTASGCRNLRKLHITPLKISKYDLYRILCHERPCKELQDLSILFQEEALTLSANGHVHLATRCPKLHSIEYGCKSLTNVALIVVVKQFPNLHSLGIILDEFDSTEYLTHKPFDYGFATIIHNYKNLKHLSMSGVCITERLLQNIGAHGKKLETLKISYNTSLVSGLHHILLGCTSLRSLVLEECEFEDDALLAIDSWPETFESFKMWPTVVVYGTCKLLKERHSGLIFEVDDEIIPLSKSEDDLDDDDLVDSLHIYILIMCELLLSSYQP